MKVERIKERVEEKEGIPPQQQRLIYSGKQMWVPPPPQHELSFSAAAATWQHLYKHLMPSPALFFSQEWWEDSCRLQDPGRLSAPSCAGAKRRLDAPQVLHTPLLLVMSRCRDGASQRFRCLSQSTMLQHREIPSSRAKANKQKNHKQQENEKKGTFWFLCRCFVL